MEHTLHQWYLLLWWTVWEFLIAFSEAACHRKIPLQSQEKKSWWAAHKHHRYYVNGHVNMYVNPCHPMCTHQTAIRARIKGAKPAAEPVVACISLPRLSFVFCAVVSASALIIDVSACIRRTMMDPGRCAGPQGGAPKKAPTHCVGPTVPSKATEEQRAESSGWVPTATTGKSKCACTGLFLSWSKAEQKLWRI